MFCISHILCSLNVEVASESRGYFGSEFECSESPSLSTDLVAPFMDLIMTL